MKCEECPGRFMAFTDREDRKLPPKGVPEPELYCGCCGTKMMPYSDYSISGYDPHTGDPISYWVKVACPLYERPYKEILGTSSILKRTLKRTIRSTHKRNNAKYNVRTNGWSAYSLIYDNEE